MRNRLLSDDASLAERCLTVSLVFGDKFAIDFWSVALYYLSKLRSERAVTGSDTAEESQQVLSKRGTLLITSSY